MITQPLLRTLQHSSKSIRIPLRSTLNQHNTICQRYQHTDTTHYTIPRHMITSAPIIAPHKIIGTCGLVQGNTVRTRDVARDYFAGLRALFGGELTTYTTLMAEAREEAIQRMVQDAAALGANGIVSVRISTNAVAGNASEMLAYGTAVIVEADPNFVSTHSTNKDTDQLHIDSAAQLAKDSKPFNVQKPTI